AAEHAAAFERVFGTPHGTDLQALCHAHGIGHTKVTDPAHVNLTAAEPGMHVVEIPVSRASHRDVHALIRRRAAEVLAPSEPCPHPPRASRMGTSFATLSANSAAGSEPATIPHPANSRIRAPSCGSTCAQRRAIPHSPSPAASIHTTGPASPPRSMPSSLRIVGEGA